MNQIGDKGFTFDVGPTIVMMPELYREVFEQCGRDPDDYIPMEKVEPLMEISFSSGERMRLSKRLSEPTASLEAVSEQDAQEYFAYLGQALSLLSCCQRQPCSGRFVNQVISIISVVL